MDLMIHWQKVVSRLSELNNPQKVIFFHGLGPTAVTEVIENHFFCLLFVLQPFCEKQQ